MTVARESDRNHFWLIATALCGASILGREFGGLFEGGEIRFGLNVTVHFVLFACVPIGFIALTTLFRDLSKLPESKWWIRVGIWKIMLASYFVSFAWILFGSATRLAS